jgi:hypothetical protein
MFFYGTSIKDPKVDRLLDLARLILEPDYARKTHITLRGPYSRKPKRNVKWLTTEIGPVTFTKPGCFFNERQNTVYLRAEISGIAEIWSKPDYPEGVPHLSLYDGEDRTFAWALFSLLKEFSWQIQLALTNISIIEKKKNLVTSYILDEEVLKFGLEVIGAKQYTMEQIRDMHDGQRLHLVHLICNKIHLSSLTDYQSEIAF